MAKQRLVFAFSVIFSTVLTIASGASLVTFVFGDSLTEVGNNNHLQYSLARSDYPWYGIDFSGGQATGRFTNGRTMGDIISEKLGITSPPPYLSLAINDDALLKGVNYASGGAGILNETGLYFIQRLTFDDQINYFKDTKESIRAKIGDVAANKLCNEAMFFVGIGSNDYVNNFLQPFLPDGQQYTHDEFVELLISTLDGQLSKLYQLGARKLILHGLGPLGCIPSQRVKSKTGKCLKQVNKWVKEFNSKAQTLIASLNKRLPSARFLFADTYPAVFDLIARPTAYGFKISNTSCCNVDTSVGGLCLPNSNMCKNRKDYVFWDAFHPSDAANQVLADELFSSVFSGSPAPAPQPH
ncbi:GDSL esterase/lipase At5g37690-like [Mangifera indica]|uniref:GDSL esterase/lipase At5g37690-like n=1 Tax=Mangifera indica TaxID=29780 RepID=UPI001CFA4346|nr:GDSL esterase/lipase At5g37690-like [Mangifera indica]XP_044478723.1 GDSL esterase/lipase At5g37690-like [Mangifera indica]